MKFEGNDLLSQLGGSALEGTVKSQLDKVYQTVGIKPAPGSVTFGKDGAFSTQMGNYKLSGTYTFDPSTHVAAMKFAKEKLGKEKLDLGEVPGARLPQRDEDGTGLPGQQAHRDHQIIRQQNLVDGDHRRPARTVQERIHRIRIQQGNGRKCEIVEKNS